MHEMNLGATSTAGVRSDDQGKEAVGPDPPMLGIGDSRDWLRPSLNSPKFSLILARSPKPQASVLGARN